VILRNYEGIITSYQEPENYENKFCDRDCKNCILELHIEGGDEIQAIGIEKLLSDSNDSISLIPEDNERHNRREQQDG
jgi:lysine 2,3-aminomutase